MVMECKFNAYIACNKYNSVPPWSNSLCQTNNKPAMPNNLLIHKPSFLRIMPWNADGISKKKADFTHFIEDKEIDIALIQETHLKPGNRFNVSNYTTYRNGRLWGRKGGTMILVKKNIHHLDINTTTAQIETTTVRVQLHQHPDIKIVSAYIAPDNVLTPQDVTCLFPDNSPTIVGGDMNAKHTDWGCNYINIKGQIIKQTANLNNFKHHVHRQPHAPTKQRTQTGQAGLLPGRQHDHAGSHQNRPGDPHTPKQHSGSTRSRNHHQINYRFKIPYSPDENQGDDKGKEQNP